MDGPQAFEHLDYDLLCRVSIVDGGKFSAAVVATSKNWPHRPRTLHLHPRVFATVAEAFESARSQSISWVIRFG